MKPKQKLCQRTAISFGQTLSQFDHSRFAQYSYASHPRGRRRDQRKDEPALRAESILAIHIDQSIPSVRAGTSRECRASRRSSAKELLSAASSRLKVISTNNVSLVLEAEVVHTSDSQRTTWIEWSSVIHSARSRTEKRIRDPRIDENQRID